MSSPEKFEATVAVQVAMLCEAFGRKPSKATFLAYEAGLAGLTAEQIKIACQASLQQNRQFMPTPGELREIGLAGGRTYEAVVGLAWECLNRGIEAVGYTGSPNFTDALINATVRQLGGWERCCGLGVDEFEKWYRKDFEKTYLQFLRNGCSPEMLRPLVGSTERENGRYHGLPNPRTGKVYLLPEIVPVGAPYMPQVLALPAPDRRPVDIPQIEFKRIPAEEADPPKRVSRIIKKDFSKHLHWNEKADLEFQLTPEQLEAQERNRKLLQQLT